MSESSASPPPEYRALDLLTAPVWVVVGRGNEVVFANQAAERLSAASDLHELRHGSHSAHAEEHLAAYLPALRAREPIIEIWTLHRNREAVPLSCQLSLLHQNPQNERILVEGILSSLPSAPVSQRYDIAEHGLYDQLFHANGAPMLLIDPAADGLIVDANLAACRFYGYTREGFCRKHTWEINGLGRQVLPIMSEVAKLPGGHRPLNFVHRLADGSLRDVQTYASPLEMDGKRLMLCVVHDVTEQKRLKNELEYAASRDPLTGLWNRRRFLDSLDKARQQKRRNDVDYSVLILDADHFKNINDQFGHDKGDEVLVLLARTLENRVRETDSVCRWGGEEFIILLPQTDIGNATHLAECLRESVTEMQIPTLPRITVSIGVAQHQHEETTESLLKRADAALYQAKASGRNRVVVC
ncbi:sensor domain-containing diguanylate cyclase [Ferribacterium limneticum]|uniref:sensor domain-containing diguanylate cyclase n=1 Tax=Ferribacterium limneticum TaxID=76259 RepID=UPI001CFAEE79|nr:diguanylate cyclase [Ferribacterium limneticum]UCV20666.1 diguanylate cyclase [Ferribacterium limneticum]